MGDPRLSPALRDRAVVEVAGCNVAISIKLDGCLIRFSFPKSDDCRVGKEKKGEERKRREKRLISWNSLLLMHERNE